MARKNSGTRTNAPSGFDSFTASTLLANDYIATINNVMELATDLNRFHAEMNDFLLEKLKPHKDVDLTVLTMAIGLTYAVQTMSWFFAPICPRALVAFLEKYQGTLSDVVAYLQSGNVNDNNTRKHLQMLLDRYHEFSHTISGCLGLPIELSLTPE